jgi:hypothetical protein
MESDTRVLDHRSKLLDLHMSGSICEGRKRRFITRSGTCCGKRQSKRSALLQPSKDRTKNQSRGQKVCINNPSHRCVPVARLVRLDLATVVSVLVLQGLQRSYQCHYLRVAIWFPRCDYSYFSVIVIGNCPHLEGWSVLQGSAIP